ncbi:MAG: zinc-dependent alcohol dehydrogenase family protein [Terriglobia bacterium]|jgi:propanol-preferring alcohol dehydrogenase
MRAMLLEKPRPAVENPLRLTELPMPEPAPGEIRVRVRACGVCHTDLHVVEGDLPLPKLPVVPGHQIVGTVDALGAGVNDFRHGDRVGVPWLNSTCGECVYCRKGLENLCGRAQFTGFHADGGYAEAMVAPAAFAYALPASYSDLEAAPLLCAGVIGYRALKLSNLQPGERLGLYGFGASAHIVIQIARHRGCEVCVFTRAESHRQLARQLGAVWTGTAGEPPPAPLDAAIIFAPAGGLVPQALRALRKGGTLALAGITMSSLPEMDYQLLYHERILRSVANSTREDVRSLLRLAAEVPLRIQIEPFQLPEANHALQNLKSSRIHGAGVLVI